jgi:hypothetical protein
MNVISFIFGKVSYEKNKFNTNIIKEFFINGTLSPRVSIKNSLTKPRINRASFLPHSFFSKSTARIS